MVLLHEAVLCSLPRMGDNLGESSLQTLGKKPEACFFYSAWCRFWYNAIAYDIIYYSYNEVRLNGVKRSD